MNYIIMPPCGDELHHHASIAVHAVCISIYISDPPYQSPQETWRPLLDVHFSSKCYALNIDHFMFNKHQAVLTPAQVSNVMIKRNGCGTNRMTLDIGEVTPAHNASFYILFDHASRM